MSGNENHFDAVLYNNNNGCAKNTKEQIYVICICDCAWPCYTSHMCLSMDRQVANFDILQLWPMFVHLYNNVHAIGRWLLFQSNPLTHQILWIWAAQMHQCTSVPVLSAPVLQCTCKLVLKWKQNRPHPILHPGTCLGLDLSAPFLLFKVCLNFTHRLSYWGIAIYFAIWFLSSRMMDWTENGHDMKIKTVWFLLSWDFPRKLEKYWIILHFLLPEAHHREKKQVWL